MIKKVSVSSVVQLLFNNLFLFLFLFVFGFMVSYFFSANVLERNYTSVAHLEIGKVGGTSLESVGVMLKRIEASSFDVILRENYDVPVGSQYKFKRDKIVPALIKLHVTTIKPEEGTHLQNILLSMIRDIQKNTYEILINDIHLKIFQLEDRIKKNKVDKLDVASIFAGDKDFNALAAYLEISENRLIRQMEIKKEIFRMERMLRFSKKTKYIASLKTQDTLNFSFPNFKTHLGFGFFLSLFFAMYLLYRKFKDSASN